MKYFKIIFSVLLFFAMKNTYAEISISNFTFKEKKFGDPPTNQFNAPWEMDWKTLSYISEYLKYPKIKKQIEIDKNKLIFGNFQLSEINYKYYDNKLIEINTIFHLTKNCDILKEIIEMLEIRYSINFLNKSNKYISIKEFNNNNVSITVSCKDFTLSEPSKNISINFRDISNFNKSVDYINIENKNFDENEKLKKNEEIRKKINF